MDTLISVLLYLHGIPGPGVYPQQMIEQVTAQMQPQIQMMEMDPLQMQNAMMVEGPIADQVVIISDWTIGK